MLTTRARVSARCEGEREVPVRLDPGWVVGWLLVLGRKGSSGALFIFLFLFFFFFFCFLYFFCIFCIHYPNKIKPISKFL
jgi:hypothetical protein